MNAATIKEMRHAIGLDYQNPKHGKYKAYRNYCMYTAPHPIWENLIKEGLAECYSQEKNERGNSYYYCLTRAGLDLMEAMIGAKIEVAR